MNTSQRALRSIVLTVFVFAFALVPLSSVLAASTIGTNMLTTGNFEGQNTASAAYFLTGNTIQVGGFASVAYNRFGTATTTHAGSVDGSDDILISG